MKEIPFDPMDVETLDRVRQMPVFDAIDGNRLPRILSMAKLRRYEKDEVIIREGDTDKVIYFLILGSCDVIVNGATINTIANVGAIFGEMGIIDNGPRSATIRAVKPVLCLAIDGNFMEALGGIDKLAAQALFYRIFSEILAGRMRECNAKVQGLEVKLADFST